MDADPESGSGRARRRRRRRGVGRGIEGPPSPERRAAQAIEELRGLVRCLGEALGAPEDEPWPLSELVVPIAVPLGGASRAPIDGAAVRSLVELLRGRVAESLQAVTAWRPGTVYCFQCESSACTHAEPPDRSHTFSGYAPSGRPEWLTFTNLCIACREPRVDRLYSNDPEIIALAQDADELSEGLLAGFGQGTLAYRVHGQVVAGLVPRDLHPGHAGQGRRAEERLALTFQLVETRSGEEIPRLRLNALGMTFEEIATAAADAGSRGPAESLRRTLAETRQRLHGLGTRMQRAERRGGAVDLGELVGPFLHRLRGDVERVFRPVQRRTQHAEHRHQDGERPTGHALRDVRHATDDQIMVDVTRDTIVVLASKGRAHVFSRDGRHVTSLRLRPGELDRKAGKNRWRPLPADGVAAFRAQVDGRQA